MTGASAVSRWLVARWRQSLLLSFTLIGIAAVAVLAVVLAQVVGHQIRSDGLARAQSTAELVGRSSFAPRLPRPGQPLGRKAVRELDAQVAAARASQPGTTVKLYDRAGRVLYANGVSAPAPRNGVGTHVVGHGATRRVRSVLPVRTASAAPPAAYLQLEIPYGPIAHDIHTRTRRLDILLALTAIVVYLLALPVMLRARRAMRIQYDPRRMALAHDVKRAAKRGELTLEYQPIVAAGTGRLRSVEVLVRWQDPRRGMISPGTFIPALEATDAIWDLSETVFELAFAQCAEWRSQGLQIPIALNVSAAVLFDRRLEPTLRRLADSCGPSSETVELEITEGALVQEADTARRQLRRIADIGFRVIAIDDFGTGYSSLARLHELPLDTLKVDQSFIKRLAAEGDATIVRSVIDLAHALGLDVIAEGVEDELTAARLLELGAEFIQGYWVSRPLTPDGLIEWLGLRRGIAFIPGESGSEARA
jgi:EAL domain-containing protein (putative c-di-GMP-specific phosphodiesterase class I)